jgi:hypothetical protein
VYRMKIGLTCLTFRVMDQPARDPLVCSFERHLHAENRSGRTVTTYLIAVRQADVFLRGRGTTIEAATPADLEAFMGDLLARRAPATAATYYKVLKILYALLGRGRGDPGRSDGADEAADRA